MTRRVAFLITSGEVHNDNHERLPRMFREAGWAVHTALHNDAQWRDQQLFIGSQPANGFDLVWPVGFGPRSGFFDRMQLLGRMDQSRLITRASAYLTLHGKTAWLAHAPATVVAHHSAPLVQYLQTQGGDWILKPVAGSFGRDVYRVSAAADIEQAVDAAPDNYWMLQRYIPEIINGETRTLICHDAIIGSYLRIPSDNLHANLAADANVRATRLNDADRELVERIHRTLLKHQVGFAAIDTVGGYVMEVNLANPGGLGTLSDFPGADAETRLRQAIQRRLPTSPHA